MALVKESIEIVEKDVEYVTKDIEDMASTIDTFSAQLNNDTNYQTFVTGTDIGELLNDKLVKLIDITKNLKENELQNIVKITSEFVQLQKLLNERGN